MTTPPLSNIVTKPNTSSPLSDHGGRKVSFRIDAKFFSFSFNGGQPNSYAIHECSQHAKHSIWVGCKGFEWILSCFVDIHDWVLGKVSHCKRFQENNKSLEFCGRSNKAGIFVVIAEYYGGARQGCVMIPASTNRLGWSLFHKELGFFFSGDKSRPRNRGGSGDFPPANGGRNRLARNNYGNQRKLRNFEILGDKLGNNVILRDSTKLNGRPTHAFTFKLTTENLALRVFKPEDGKRKCFKLKTNDTKYGPLKVETWIKPSDKDGLFNEKVQRPLIPSNTMQLQADSGPGKSGVLVRASRPILLPNIIGRSSSETRMVTANPKAQAKGLLAQSHALETGGLKLIHGSVDESSNAGGCMPMEVSCAPGTETDMERVCSSSEVDPDSGKDGEALRPSGVTGDKLVTSAITAMESPILKNGSQSHGQHQWVDQNRFSPLSELGNEMGVEFGEGEDREEDFSEYHEVAVQPRSVDTAGFCQNDSGLLFLLWDNSGANNCGGGSGVKENCFLECNPLSQWDPNTLSELVMVQDDAGGARMAEAEPNSSWSSQLIKDFCNMVGFPILKHEAQCLALFHLLEQECLKVIDDGVPKQPANSRTRGLGELKGLISNVNYDGASSRSRSRAPSNAVGIVGFK